MLRIWVPVAVVSLLAACSSVPPQSASRSASGMKITTPRAFPAPANFPKFVDHSVGQEEISIQAMSLVGVPYRWGGNTPASGFDCSGLVRYVIGRAADVNLPRTTADMSSRGVSIEPDEIAPGDLIFFNTTGRPHSHVGIYVGKLRFVNAPSTGGTVRLDYLTNPYWAKRFDGIRRVAPPRSAPTPFDAPTYEAKRDEPRNPPALAAAPAVVTAAAAPRQPAAYASSRARATQAPAPASAIPTAPVVTATATAPAAPAADPYEPPPPRMQTAQQQATSVNDGATAMTANAAPTAPAEVGTQIPTTALTAAEAAAFDAEPPPAAGTPPRTIEPAQVLRASTQSAPISPRTSTADDPIARFANGSY
ncbi:MULTISPECIES: C40 family peptidase [Burkholderia]|uniref:C40 family peptidase n=1 Tax=Burkholderia TaxID=32008 RepID=UPI0007523E1F|nr:MULTISPECIES: C40 family peptidase [Burkholderia]KVH03097.1 hydrolase Nlp/P60 [Burkholderia anthina]KVH14758.1 hydrolase Nlp/P60 [Burkholderia anthina]KVM93395.1 hydrolase Nlp/P60 [Burkholderia anthina]KVN55470.1 hydrolase Nlp/P60 [Burkholderia anthina]KVX35754.1 hydrolase Nlp/P60 [Burkholderia anthina]